MTKIMNKTIVALVRCDTYEEDRVFKAVQEGLDLLGGASVFAKSNEKIVLKPNVLIGTNPENCVTTHPAVFKAVGRSLMEAGASVYYGDSPAFGKAEANMKKSGLKQVADESGFSLADFDAGRPGRHPEGLPGKSLVIGNGVLNCDGLGSR